MSARAGQVWALSELNNERGGRVVFLILGSEGTVSYGDTQHAILVLDNDGFEAFANEMDRAYWWEPSGASWEGDPYYERLL